MNSASGFNSDMLRNLCNWEAMNTYLREGETREAILKNFSGNVDKAITFLRERSYEGLEIVERKPKKEVKKKAEKEKSEIFDPKYDPANMIIPEEKSKEKKKKAPAKKGASQEKLF